MTLLKKVTLIVIFTFLLHYSFSVISSYLLPSLIWDPSTGPTSNFNNSELLDGKEVTFSAYKLLYDWDSTFYMDIVQNGYEKLDAETGGFHNWAFYPLYPITIKIIVVLFDVVDSQSAVFYIGILLSNIFFGVGLYYLYCMFRKLGEHDSDIDSMVLLLIAFPSAYFFNIFYTESLFFMISVLFFYFLFQKKYIYVCIILSLSLITRINALSLFIPFAIAIIYENRKNYLGILKSILLYPLIIFTPLVIFYYHLNTLTGSFFASFKAQGQWGNKGSYFLSIFKSYLDIYGFSFRAEHILTLALLILIGFILVFALVKVFKKNFGAFKIEYIIMLSYAISYYVILSSVNSIASIFRYVLPCFIYYWILTKFFKVTQGTTIFSILLIILVLFHGLFFSLFLSTIPAYGF